jgi:hypothetical protein
VANPGFKRLLSHGSTRGRYASGHDLIPNADGKDAWKYDASVGAVTSQIQLTHSA